MDITLCGKMTEISGCVLDAAVRVKLIELIGCNEGTSFRGAPIRGSIWTLKGRLNYCSYSTKETTELIKIMGYDD